MNESHRFETLVARDWRVESWRASHVIVAVSGGSDSVALFRVLDRLWRGAAGRGELSVAHYDHRCRGPVSSEDAAWVGRLAAAHGRPLHLGVAGADTPRSEEALRDERRRFFAELADRTGARCVATGHTADDQIETVLFRLLRGSGLAGLRGIARSRPLTHAAALVRPLLSLRRGEAQAYLRDLGQDYRTDATNASLEPTRNWIRAELLPLVESRFGVSAGDAILRASDQAADTQAVIQRLAAETLARAEHESSADSIELAVDALAAAPSLVVIEAMRAAWRDRGWPEQPMTASHWGALAEVVCGRAAATTLPGAVRATSDGERARIARAAGGGRFS